MLLAKNPAGKVAFLSKQLEFLGFEFGHLTVADHHVLSGKLSVACAGGVLRNDLKAFATAQSVERPPKDDGFGQVSPTRNQGSSL
ncbi:MAG: hypothetical protein H7A33_07000 [Deltaproteobacteria bacterium]|nr:hypothetical protein [Deltaproteobacteria bacterium]